MPSEHDDAVDQRVKRLIQRFAHAKLSSTFAAWREAAEFERSVIALETLLEPAGGVFDQPSHERSGSGVSAVLELLRKVALYEALCLEAQRFIAAHARLQILSDCAEMPSCDLDNMKLYAVLCGKVSLIHGNPDDPQLQQIIQAAQQQMEADQALLTAELAAVSSQRTRATASKALSPANGRVPAVAPGSKASISESRSSDAVEVGGETMPRSVGIWHQVREAVSAGQKRRIHSSLRGYKDETGQKRGISILDAGTLMSTVSVQGVKPVATFCGHQFPNTPPVAFTAAAGYTTEDAPQLSQLPSSCLAAVADNNSVAALLVISKAVYMEAMRLQHEYHVSRLVDLACRMPSLRHTPIKELYRLAIHMKESTYQPGQVLLRQGKEVSDVHFLISGTVQLTYMPSPPPAQQQKTAAGATGPDCMAAGLSTAASSSPASGSPARVGKQPAESLQAGQQQSPVDLGFRGPGSVLGDDAMRERKICVTVTAATRAVTLRVPPQKLLSYLDPLTLRLFGRLRQQQAATQQQLIQAALTESSQHSQQSAPQQQLRSVVLDQVYEAASKPLTLLRPGDAEHQQLQEQESNSHKPRWHSLRGSANSSSTPGTTSGPETSRCSSPSPTALRSGQASPVRRPMLANAVGKVRHADDHSQVSDDEYGSWEASLPKGLTLEMCAGLPQTSSVMQLVGLIRDTEVVRKLQSDSSARPASPDTLLSATQQSPTKHSSLGLEAADLRPASPAAAGDLLSSSVHTELLEVCGVAVLELNLLPGQAPVAGAALAGALDDVAAAWAAVTYDEGLQLVRWSAFKWIMVAQLDPGASKRAGLEGLAGAVLSAAVRLSGVMNRNLEVLPVVALSAGVASGSCFVQYEAGNFVCSVTGRAYDAAVELCKEAAALPATAIDRSRGSRDTSYSTVLTTDGVAAMLQTNYCLEPVGGGSVLVSAHPVLSPGTGSRSSTPPNASITAGRQTLGPGRNTIFGLGASMLNPTTPKTPGGGLVLPNWGAAQNERRRRRRKFEALQDLLAGAGDTLPPPPEHMLTQPPPVGGTKRYNDVSDFGAAGYTRSQMGGTVGAGVRTVNFGGTTELSGSGSESSMSGSGGKKGFKPRLTISVDGDAASAAAAGRGGSITAGTPGTGSTAKTPSAKTPKVAGSRGYGGFDTDSDALLTPTLVMDSPVWGSGQQGPAGRLAATTPKTPQARAWDSKGSTPSSVGGSSRQTVAAQGLGVRQSMKQQVLHEVQQMRDKDGYEAVQSPAPAGAGGASVPHNTAASSGHMSSNTGSSSSSHNALSHSKRSTRTTASLAGTASNHGGNLSSSLTGLGSSSGSGCLKSKPGRPKSAGMIGSSATGSSGDRTADGGRLKVTFQTPKVSQNSRVTSSVWGSGSGAGGLDHSHSGAGNTQQHEHPKQHAVVVSNDGARISSMTGARAGVKHPGRADAQLASKHDMLKSSMGGSSSHTGSQSGWLQQQQHLEPEVSEPDSLNSLSMYPELAGDVLNSNSRSTAAAASLAAQMEQQRQQVLVMSACKALGSYAAAEVYVAALPEGLMTVNLSAAGLTRLPSLHRLTQLDQLSASFNKLDSLPHLIPADAAAVAAAGAAATDTGRPTTSNFFAASTDGCQSPNSSTTSSSKVLDKLTQQLVSGRVSAVPPTLMRLGLAHNRLEAVPMELPAALPQLTELDLSHNQLTQLPATFGALSCLKLLFLDHNQLASLPGSFTRLFSLQTLNLSHNRLTQLPSDLHQLPGLVKLQLQHNQLQGLPSSITQLSGLKSLGLGCNKGLAVPDGMLVGLSGLTSLDLSGLGLTDQQLQAAAPAAAGVQQEAIVLAPVKHQEAEQPEALQLAADAQSAAAAASSGTAIADSAQVSMLSSLLVLDLSGNQLQQLPAWLPSSLKQLIASNNQIRELPGSFCSKLGSISLLDLHENKLTDVPRDLMLLEHIQVLALDGNPGLDCDAVGSEDSENLRGTEKSEKVASNKSERGAADSAGGMTWVYKWMMQRKASAAAALMRGVQQQRQHKQEQVAGSLLNGLLPGIRQTVIVESGRLL